MRDYTYEKWLAAHATRKSMMEKLERSLIPYELFARIPLRNSKQRISGTIEDGQNSYAYSWSYDYSKFSNDIFDVDIKPLNLQDRWNNLLLGYSRFKVVMHGDDILTIYADKEDFFHKVIEMFERMDMGSLFAHRNAYVNNLLARYILLRLIDRHIPNMQMLTSIQTERYGNVLAMAANANRTNLILYAFRKQVAIEMAKRYDGLSRSLTVVYFLNQDFERVGNSESYISDKTQVVSIRSFYNTLKLSKAEICNTERQILTLVSLLYDERLEWDIDRIENVAMNPPKNPAITDMEKKNKNKRRTKRRSLSSPRGNIFYRTLLEDSLNVLDDTPRTHLDIFHSLCAANMVNAYINFCNRQRRFSRNQLSRMFKAKQQMLHIIRSLASRPNINVNISLEDDPAVFVNIKVNKQTYQFSFRGFNSHQMRKIRQAALPTEGKYHGVILQAISTPLYQYSYLQRWASLIQTDPNTCRHASRSL